ncbi:MAG: D-cysteine desulfhydrase family protein [Candidatus Saccharicenans sp.]|uniref:D-cysteine desulfhydrase family protein n=1 Tax=Candidatus Saccharicenans sp. TaxID=2819258 RepID=UPI00404B014F
MSVYSPEQLEKLITSQPRINLISRPTPLYPLKNLAAELGLEEISIKRDDLTGLALGGNKSRKLEFILADAIRQGADTIITWGSLQSNWCLQTAAVARRCGLRPVLVLFKTYDLPLIDQGNVLLEKLLGAEIIVRETEKKGKSPDQDQAFRLMEEVAEGERRKGHQPYLVSVGGSACGGHMKKPLGAMAYFLSLLEIYRQTASSAPPDYLVVASGSGGTQAGLLVGARALGIKTKIIGICVSDKKEEFLLVVQSIALDLVKFLGLDLTLEDSDFILLDDYLGAGYGQVTPEVSAVIKLLLQKEALVLDPVYTSKAMIGLIDLARKKYFQPDDKVLFLHTGGVPALFAFPDRLLAEAG